MFLRGLSLAERRNRSSRPTTRKKRISSFSTNRFENFTPTYKVLRFLRLFSRCVRSLFRIKKIVNLGKIPQFDLRARPTSARFAGGATAARAAPPLKSTPLRTFQQSRRPLKPARQAVEEKKFRQNRRFYQVIACLKRPSQLSLRR